MRACHCLLFVVEFFLRGLNRFRCDLASGETRLFFSANGTFPCQPGVERREQGERRATQGYGARQSPKAPTGRPESEGTVFTPKYAVYQWKITLDNDQNVPVHGLWP